LTEKKLPFKDKEFDFVIASHVMEHVEDVDFFITELERISYKGYIEVPTILEDNLVFENKKDHLWHMDFDDVDLKLLISKKIQYFEPILTVSSIKDLNNIFRRSFILELTWENKIDYIINKEVKENFEKISILKLFKKYFSKKLRMLF
jgi:ubiquinone/menaquinone biosynthesis C-methylase UbiE